MLLPKKGEEIDENILKIHKETVDLAMKNRRELIRIILQLFDLKDLITPV